MQGPSPTTSHRAPPGDPEMAAGRGGPSGLRRTGAAQAAPRSPSGGSPRSRGPPAAPVLAWGRPGQSPAPGTGGRRVRAAAPAPQPAEPGRAAGAPNGAAEAELLGLRRARRRLPAGGGRARTADGRARGRPGLGVQVGLEGPRPVRLGGGRRGRLPAPPGLARAGEPPAAGSPGGSPRERRFYNFPACPCAVAVRSLLVVCFVVFFPYFFLFF